LLKGFLLFWIYPTANLLRYFKCDLF
jgi:hypothetical protein